MIFSNPEVCCCLSLLAEQLFNGRRESWADARSIKTSKRVSSKEFRVWTLDNLVEEEVIVNLAKDNNEKIVHDHVLHSPHLLTYSVWWHHSEL